MIFSCPKNTQDRRIWNTAGKTEKHDSNQNKFDRSKQYSLDTADKYNTNTRHARQADRRELLTRLSYALSAAASIRSDALPVGIVPCGDAE